MVMSVSINLFTRLVSVHFSEHLFSTRVSRSVLCARSANINIKLQLLVGIKGEEDGRDKGKLVFIFFKPLSAI